MKTSSRGAITITQKGSFNNSKKFLHDVMGISYTRIITPHVEKINKALSSATPVDTGKTAASWYYSIKEKNDVITITWNNSNEADGVPIVVLLYYGHGTPSGKYVQGRDFITPTVEPLINEMIDDVWKEVTKK